MANEVVYTLGTDQNMFENGTLLGSHRGMYEVGNDPIFGEEKGALRFPNIAIPKAAVNIATLRIYVEAKGSGGGASQLKMKVYGIGEDNCSDFGSDPFPRSKTTAFVTDARTMPAVGSYIEINVTSIVSELAQRSGWASGNAIGFFLDNNNSDSDNWVYDDTAVRSELVIRTEGEPNFFPTPQSVAAPTFPDTTHIGIRISKPGIDVKTATESQLLFWTRKKEYKIISSVDVACTANVEKVIAHGLSYSPALIAYVESGGYRFKLNRDFLGATDPISGGAQGYIGSDDTNIRIIVDKSKNVYYYIFIDELEE